MKQKHYCRCCLSEECYKDMANKYFIGNETENYFEMLLNIFNINITNGSAQRCLICEDCVSKLREAAEFKKKVLHVQEIIQKNLCWDINNHNLHTREDTKIEDNDYFDDFEDDLSDSFNDNNLVWENFTQHSSQKGEVLFITQETKIKTKNENIIKNSNIFSYASNDITRNISIIQKDRDKIINDKNVKTLETDDDDSNYNMDMQSFDDNEDLNILEISKKTEKRRSVKIKPNSAKQNNEKIIKKKSRIMSDKDLSLKYKNDNTFKLVQNSNLCLFRSFQNKFGCSYCQTKFPEISQLREHSLTCRNLKNVAWKFSRLRGLSCKNAEISDLKCIICSENCTDLKELMDHLNNKHEISFHGTEHFLVPYKLQNGFQCLLCELKFNTYMRLSVHMNTHFTNNVCEKCGMSFINRLGLRAHVHSQHKEKKCSRCPAMFLTNSSRSKHLRQAHGIRNSKRYCNLCNKVFRYAYILNEHKIQEHGLKRPISNCVECGKSFLTATNLKTHVRSVHIKERNYPCTKCGMRFFTKCDQKRHERTHEDVRSFCCSYCEAKFKSKDSWRRHLKRQHGHVFETTATT